MAPWVAAALGAPLAGAEATMPGDQRATRIDSAVAGLVAGSTSEARLVVLDDAHWLDDASASVLRVLARRRGTTALLVTSRPGEAAVTADLGRSEPSAIHVVLGALRGEAVAALAARLLGVDEIPSRLRNLLVERAGGHPFFTEELLRLLLVEGAVVVGGGRCRFEGVADDAAALLPTSVEGVVRSRLDRATPSARRLLKLAAILGRHFEARDVEALGDASAGAEAAHETAAHVDASRGADPWAELLSAGLLVGSGETAFSFRHAIVHGVAYEAVPFALRRRLHRRVADLLARQSGVAPAREAFHLARSIDPAAVESALLVRALDRHEAAGEAAAAAFSNEDIVTLYGEALKLAALQQRAVAERRLANWHRRVGEACYRLGRPAQAGEHLREALRLAGRPIPRSSAGVLWRLLRAGTGEARRRWREAMGLAAPVTGSLRPVEAARLASERAVHLRARSVTAELLAFVSMLRSADATAVLATLNAVADAEEVGPCAEYASALALLGLGVAGRLGTPMADVWLLRAAAAAEASGEGGARAKVHFMQGFALLGESRWEEARVHFLAAADLFEAEGDVRLRETMHLHLGNIGTLSHRYDEGDGPYRLAQASAAARGDTQVQAWANVGMSHSALCRGDHAAALAMHARVRAWAGDDFLGLADRASALGVLGMEAAAWQQSGRGDEARAALRQAHAIRGGVIRLYHASTGYTHLSDAALRLVERERTAGRRDRELERLAADFEGMLWSFARTMPIGRPQAHIARGLRRWLAGHRRAARRHWERAIEEARRLDMPRDEAVARYEIGRHLPCGDARRERELVAALETFRRIGASWWALQVSEEIEGAAALSPTEEALRASGS